MALLLVVFPIRVSEDAHAQQNVSGATTTTIVTRDSIKAKLIKVFGGDSVMIDIASCESGYRQFNSDGSVHRGETNPRDVGTYQINEHFWLEESKRLGFDIYTIDGNIAMAKYIYQHHGSQPWHWSYEMRPGYGWKYGECNK